MEEKHTRHFVVDGISKTFNFDSFNDLLINYQVEHNLKFNELEGMLSESVGVTPEAVHNWRFRNNGPADVETMQKIAGFLGVESVSSLLKTIRPRKLSSYSEDIKQAFCRIYNTLVDYLYLQDTNYYSILVAVKREYIIIQDTEILTRINNFIYSTLYSEYELGNSKENENVKSEMLFKFISILEEYKKEK